MHKNKFPLLQKQEQLILNEALHFMKMDELKKSMPYAFVI